MRKFTGLIVAIAALAASGLAIAHGFDTKSIKAVSATFTATTPAGTATSRTCTGADGTYVSTKASYTGTATSSEASLNGPIRIDTDSLINTTTNVGTVSGKIRFGDHGNNVHFETVLTGGNAAGVVEGGSLFGNISGPYSVAGGFTATGKIGGGTTGGDAVLTTRGGCEPVKPPPPPKPQRIEVHNGVVTAVSSTSITAAGVTCQVPTELQSAVANVHQNDVVDMTCESSNGTTTLTHIGEKHGKDHGKTEVKHFSDKSHRR